MGGIVISHIYLEHQLHHGFIDSFTGRDQQVHLCCLRALVECMTNLLNNIVMSLFQRHPEIVQKADSPEKSP